MLKQGVPIIVHVRLHQQEAALGAKVAEEDLSVDGDGITVRDGAAVSEADAVTGL